jgi:hypothetical protein
MAIAVYHADRILSRRLIMDKRSRANGLWLALVGLSCSTLVGVTAHPSYAAEPKGVLRTFIVLELTEGVDFLHEDPVMVKAKKGPSAPVLLEFVDENDPELSDFDFDETLWVAGPAMYITKGQGLTQLGPFFWLLTEETPEPPPVGSLTLTGPEALLVQETVTYEVCSGDPDCDGKYALTNAPTGTKLTVVTAIFSR